MPVKACRVDQEGGMVVLVQKIGTLCIEYRPAETMSSLSYDDGMFDENDCDHFLLSTKFFPGYVPLLPIYALDYRCYSKMQIKCYSLFDAIDFIEHLELHEYEFKLVEAKMDAPDAERAEFDIVSAEFEGSFDDFWTIRIVVSQKPEAIILSNRGNQTDAVKNLKLIYARDT